MVSKGEIFTPFSYKFIQKKLHLFAKKFAHWTSAGLSYCKTNKGAIFCLTVYIFFLSFYSPRGQFVWEFPYSDSRSHTVSFNFVCYLIVNVQCGFNKVSLSLCLFDCNQSKRLFLY